MRTSKYYHDYRRAPSSSPVQRARSRRARRRARVRSLAPRLSGLSESVRFICAWWCAFIIHNSVNIQSIMPTCARKPQSTRTRRHRDEPTRHVLVAPKTIQLLEPQESPVTRALERVHSHRGECTPTRWALGHMRARVLGTGSGPAGQS